jgi:hypothetical protein
MRIESLLVYLPAMSRWLPSLAIVVFAALLLGLALLALAGDAAADLLGMWAPDAPMPFRWWYA